MTAVSPLEDPDVDAREAKVVLISACSPLLLLSPMANFDCSLDCSQGIFWALDQEGSPAVTNIPQTASNELNKAAEGHCRCDACGS